MTKEFTEDVILKNSDGDQIFIISADEQTLKIQKPDGKVLVELGRTEGGNDGDIFVSNKDGKRTIHLGGNDARLSLGGDGSNDGDIFIHNKEGKRTIHLGGNDARLWLGGHGSDGDIFINDKVGTETIRLNADQSSVVIRDEQENPVIQLDGRKWELYETSQWLGATLAAELGAEGVEEGEVEEVEEKEIAPIYLNGPGGTIRLGSSGAAGNLFVYDKSGSRTIHLDGDAGDIVLHNADLAEEFPVASMADAEPGTVMVIEESGELAPCAAAGDTRVIGVVSGAGGYQPAIVMDRNPSVDSRVPIATSGKVFCKATAEETPIRTGDLLTTSSVPGHAMRLPDNNRSVGTVIGKALEPLEGGRSLVPILVMLR